MTETMDAVDRVLAQRGARAARSRRMELLALAGAALLHGGIVAVSFGLARLRPAKEPLEYVAAQIIPAQALGVERPKKRVETPPEPQPEPPAPEPEAPAPEPPAPEPPAPTPPPQPTPKAVPPTSTGVLPRPKGWDDPPKPATPPAPVKPAPAAKPPAGPPKPTPAPPTPGAEIGKGQEAGRRGSPIASPTGTAALGSEIAGLDNPDFTYGYYIDRLLERIDANWVRPPVGDRIRAIVHFRIAKGGTIDQLEMRESSGINAFDLAALRAVQNAAPFPPLPASYPHPSLGVNLIVH
ncbi:MAG TPA: energy transducer TonB [Thermoanaerobaculia bacterium]|nr:energy transducer TonB [Thermoanaerobaculia bacterium]